MLQWIAQHPAIVIFFMFVSIAAIEAMRGLFRSPYATREDAPLETVITLLFGAVIYPGVLLLVGFFARHYTPNLAGSLSHLPIWLMILPLLICDDMTQSWWPPASHTPLQWPLHRPPHSPPLQPPDRP